MANICGNEQNKSKIWLWQLFATFIAISFGSSIAKSLSPLSPLYSQPDFKAYKIDFPSWSSLPKSNDPLNKLQSSEIRFNNTVKGPECIAFDTRGRGPYTGTADGRVVFWNGSSWSDFAYTSPNRSEEVCADGKPENGYICGRPAGLRFDKRNGDLYIADAYFGVLKVGPNGGLATPVADQVNGVALKFVNDLDVDSNGVIYFSQSSTKYSPKDAAYILFSGERSGRVMKYDPTTDKTIVLLRNLSLTNGLTLSKDESFFLVCESALGRVTRYWLKDAKAGTADTFAVLPGHPDNVRTNAKGEFWIALAFKRSVYSHVMGLYPKYRKDSLKEPISIDEQMLAYHGGRPHGAIVKYNANGDFIEILEDKDGMVVGTTSHVEEKDGQLWLGTFVNSYIAVYSLA